jgi:hypothetical protein
VRKQNSKIDEISKVSNEFYCIIENSRIIVRANERKEVKFLVLNERDLGREG